MNTHFFSMLMSMPLGGPFEPHRANYQYSNVRRWTLRRSLTKMAQRSETPLACDLIIVPINLPGHWVCAAIDLVHRRLYFMDSMGTQRPEILEALARWVYDESRCDLKGKPPRIPLETKDWPHVMPGLECPQQENMNDCGVFTLMFVDYLARGVSVAARGGKGRFPTALRQGKMGYYRQRIARDLLQERAD